MAPNIYIIGQNGRLQYEALLCMISFLRCNNAGAANLFVCTPKNSSLWDTNPDMSNSEIAETLRSLGVNVVTFDNTHFGTRYPHSNKVYALAALPPDEPFIFFDSDHIFKAPLESVVIDFKKPIARQTALAWPVVNKTNYSRAELWQAIYDMFNMSTSNWFRDDFPISDPRRFPYFNGGVFFGDAAGKYFNRYKYFMEELDENPPEQLDKWSLYPFLDQVTLPLVMKDLGGLNDYYDGDYPFNSISKHYFAIPYLFFQPNNEWQKISESIVNDPQFSKLFEADETFRHYFFGEGNAGVKELSLRMKDQGYFKKGNWPTPANLKQALIDSNLWIG